MSCSNELNHLIRLILCFILHGNYFKKKLAIYHSISGKKTPNTVTSVYFYRFLILCFLECKPERSKLKCCFSFCHFPCLNRHSASVYSLSTLKGKKMPFIFIRVKDSPKYFALNVPKLKGHYDLTDSQLHHYRVPVKMLRNRAFFTVPRL